MLILLFSHIVVSSVQVNGQRLAYKFVNLPSADKPVKNERTPSPSSQSDVTVKENEIVSYTCTTPRSPSSFCTVRPSTQFSYPLYSTVSKTNMGLQLVQSPLCIDQNGHVTYSAFQYVIPYPLSSVCPCN